MPGRWLVEIAVAVAIKHLFDRPYAFDDLIEGREILSATNEMSVEILLMNGLSCVAARFPDGAGAKQPEEPRIGRAEIGLVTFK